jgi:hypothetical protein
MSGPFDVEVDVRAAQFNHRLLARYREAEVFNVKSRRLLRSLDENVSAESIGHRCFLRGSGNLQYPFR